MGPARFNVSRKDVGRSSVSHDTEVRRARRPRNSDCSRSARIIHAMNVVLPRSKPIAIHTGSSRRWRSASSQSNDAGLPRRRFHDLRHRAASLLIADYVYFDALRNPEALVSVVSSLRRGSTLVAFAGSIWIFREARGGAKLPAVLGIVAGIVLTVLG